MVFAVKCLELASLVAAFRGKVPSMQPQLPRPTSGWGLHNAIFNIELNLEVYFLQYCARRVLRTRNAIQVRKRGYNNLPEKGGKNSHEVLTFVDKSCFGFCWSLEVWGEGGRMLSLRDILGIYVAKFPWNKAFRDGNSIPLYTEKEMHSECNIRRTGLKVLVELLLATILREA